MINIVKTKNVMASTCRYVFDLNIKLYYTCRRDNSIVFTIYRKYCAVKIHTKILRYETNVCFLVVFV